jgi:hypothetical protein
MYRSESELRGRRSRNYNVGSWEATMVLTFRHYQAPDLVPDCYKRLETIPFISNANSPLDWKFDKWTPAEAPHLSLTGSGSYLQFLQITLITVKIHFAITILGNINANVDNRFCSLRWRHENPHVPFPHLCWECVNPRISLLKPVEIFSWSLIMPIISRDRITIPEYPIWKLECVE